MILSVIVPVYNVEAYLADCLDSLLACDLTDCEIILSFRDSQDRSKEICDQYCSRFSFVRLISQDGTGLSNARNCAMQVACGDYLLYVDSDDRVDSAVLGELIRRIREGSIHADLVVTDFYRVVYPAQKLEPVFQIGETTQDQYGMQFFPHMLRRRQCFWNVWRYIYRRSFLEENHLSFRENTLSEDVDFTTKVILSEPAILFSHSPFYCYSVGRGASLMDQITLQRAQDTVGVLSDSIRRLRESSFPYRETMAAQYQFEYILSIALAAEVDIRDRGAAMALFSGHREVLRDSVDPVVSAFALFLRIAGVKVSAELLHLLKKICHRIKGRK